MMKTLNTAIFKKTVLASITLSAALAMSAAQAANWQFTPQSNVGFYIKQMGVKTVDGQFQRVVSKVNLDPKRIENAQAKLVMDVSSVNLTHNSLKNMVLGDNFFSANQYKNVVFNSTRFQPVGNNQYRILGDLTLRGVTKPVVFDAKIVPDGKNPKLLTVQAATQIKRSDFGMKPAVGGVGEMINIKVDGQLKQS